MKICYVCGKIGHGEATCDQLFVMGVDDGVRGWGSELRVENRRGAVVLGLSGCATISTVNG